MRSDGRFFVSVDTLTGEFDRGDILVLPASDANNIRLVIDRIHFVATKTSSQQCLVFKNLDSETAATLSRLVGDDCVLNIYERKAPE